MSHTQPSDVQQVTDLNNLSKIATAVHIFNSLVLDGKVRWLSEELSVGYFASKEEFQQYCKAIKGKPMDFGTIRRNIVNKKYKSNSQLLADIERVFANSLAYNTKSSPWFVAARRLQANLKSLRLKKPVEPNWLPSSIGKLACCPDCHNIMTSCKMKESRPCILCSHKMVGQRADCYMCHNHSGADVHRMCSKCVEIYCVQCSSWHSHHHPHNPNNNDPAIDLSICARPRDMKAVAKFEHVKAHPALCARLMLMLDTIKNIYLDFFKKVEHVDYASVVAKPIHFGQIYDKIHKRKYGTMAQVKSDIDLLWENCFRFNGPPRGDPDDRQFSDFAAELQSTLRRYMAQLRGELAKQGWFGSMSSSTPSSSSSLAGQAGKTKKKEKEKDTEKKKKKKKKRTKSSTSSSSSSHKIQRNNPAKKNKLPNAGNVLASQPPMVMCNTFESQLLSAHSMTYTEAGMHVHIPQKRKFSPHNELVQSVINTNNAPPAKKRKLINVHDYVAAGMHYPHHTGMHYTNMAMYGAAPIKEALPGEIEYHMRIVEQIMSKMKSERC